MLFQRKRFIIVGSHLIYSFFVHTCYSVTSFMWVLSGSPSSVRGCSRAYFIFKTITKDSVPNHSYIWTLISLLVNKDKFFSCNRYSPLYNFLRKMSGPNLHNFISGPRVGFCDSKRAMVMFSKIGRAHV